MGPPWSGDCSGLVQDQAICSATQVSPHSCNGVPLACNRRHVRPGLNGLQPIYNALTMQKIKELALPHGALSKKATEELAKLMQAGPVEIRKLLKEGKSKQAERLTDALHNVPEVFLDLPYYDIAEDVRQCLLSYQLDYAADRGHLTDYVGLLESA